MHDRCAVVSQPEANIEDCDRLLRLESFELRRHHELRVCLVQGSGGIVKCLSELRAVEAETSIGCQMSLQPAQISCAVVQVHPRRWDKTPLPPRCGPGLSPLLPALLRWQGSSRPDDRFRCRGLFP